MQQGVIQRGDILVAVEGIPVRQSTLGKISQQLLGPPNSYVQLTTRREGRLMNLHLERRKTDKSAMERAMEEAYERAKGPASVSATTPGDPSRAPPPEGPHVPATSSMVGPAADMQRSLPSLTPSVIRGGPSSSAWT